MSWLDHVRAVPAVGVRLAGPPIVGAERVPGLRSFVTTPRPAAHQSQLLRVTLPTQSPWSVQLGGDGAGLSYRIETGKAYVQFEHPHELEIQPMGGVELQRRTEQHVYSELLISVVAETAAFLRAAALDSHERVTRVGVVATARLPADNLPPGVAGLLKGTSAALGGVVACDVQFRRQLDPLPQGTVACVHRCTQDEDHDVVGVHLDWQLTLGEPELLAGDNLKDILEAAAQAAEAYFHDFGLGEL